MDWVSYIKTSENQALKEVYRKHRNTCMSWLMNTFHINNEDAKEIFQSSVITLYDNVMSGRLSSLDGSLKTYLYGIARNKYRDYRRASNKVEERVAKQNTPRGLQEKILFESRINHVDAVLQSMGNPCKKLLQVYYYKRKPVSQIAVKMGYINDDKVINQKHKCFKRLQKLIHHHINIEDDIES